MAEAELITIEVVLGESGRQTLVALRVPAGTTARQAIEGAGVFARHPGVDPAQCGVGIFGREVPAEQLLRDGDRVECLRPLPQDPRSRRRQLARQGRSMGKGSAGGR
jgi:putative ubiquitin-RnfH superfamily antitoxin RatB of RatAB toxin-antitoxin module